MRRREEYADDKAYRAAKKRASQRYRERTGSHMYWNHWTDDHYLAIMKHDMPDSQLAPLIGHSVSAIQSARRRVRLGEVIVPGYDPAMDALAPLSRHGQDDED